MPGKMVPMEKCPLCCSDFQHGNGVYGRYVPEFDATICSSCHRVTQDLFTDFQKELLIKGRH
jgi:hypothetical protein